MQQSKKHRKKSSKGLRKNESAWRPNVRKLSDTLKNRRPLRSQRPKKKRDSEFSKKKRRPRDKRRRPRGEELQRRRPSASEPRS